MKLIFALLFSMCLFLNCTDNLRPKEKSQPTIYPPVHYSLSDTLPQKLDSVTGEPKEDGSHPSQIVHKALCRYTKLSEEFDFALAVDMDGEGLGQVAYISIIPKADAKMTQVIKFNYEDEFPTRFYNCEARSFITGYNIDAVNDSGFLGDMVVGDLNFDNREDFAIFWNYGAHSTYYRYFIQDDTGHFMFDKYLTTKLESFPTDFDTINHTFEVNNIVGAWGYNLNAYKFDSEANKFIEIKNQTFDGESGKMVSGWPKIVKKKKH